MAEEKVVIQTPLGKLRGYTRKSMLSDNTYYAFQGIPFAKPPLGELRFKAPVPFGSWEGIRDALEDGNDPKQDSFIPLPKDTPNPMEKSNEDCLYLNVYIKKLPDGSSSKKPVMVSIHGGGFAGGSGGLRMAGPDFLVEEGIVLVSFNYRCNAFGFLSLGTEEVPGNAGLKDQTLVLKWVRDNISSFGGDPGNVTIFGVSAGGASVDYHLISPSSRGLFHKAIAQSGSSINPWAFDSNPKVVATYLAQQLGCKSENPDEMLLFLQSVSADDILTASKELMKKPEFKKMMFLYRPCVEVSGTDRFLSESPLNILKKGEINKVPLIVGLTAQEGSMIALLGGLSDETFKAVNAHPASLVPEYLQLKSNSNEEKEAAKAILEFYLKGKPVSWDTVNEFVQLQSDLLFAIGVGHTRTAFLEYSSSPVYSYIFTNHKRCFCSFLSNLLPEEIKEQMKSIKQEACHGADSGYLYISQFMGPFTPPNAEDKEAIKKHVKAWTSFASVGDPNCKDLGTTWERDSTNKPCHMDIGTTWELKDGIAFADRLAFWAKLYSKYNAA